MPKAPVWQNTSSTSAPTASFGGCQPIFPLIAKPAGLLTLLDIHEKLGRPFVNLHLCQTAATEEPPFEGQTFELPTLGLVPQVHRRKLQFLHQHVGQEFFPAIHAER